MRRFAWALWVLLAVPATIELRRLHVDNSLDGWIPQLRSRGPFTTYVVVGWPAQRFAPGLIEAALRAAPGVLLSLDRQTILPLTLAGVATPQDLVISNDGSYAGAFCFSDGRLSDAQFVQGVREAIAGFDPSRADDVAVAGPAAFRVAMDEGSRARMPLIICCIVVGGGLLLRWVTSCWHTALVSVTAVIISQIILLGLIVRQGHAIDMSLSMIPPLMMSLGFSYAAHRAIRRGSTIALILCGTTTAAGIASFAFSGLEPIRLFARYGTIGLILVWLATFTLVRPITRGVSRTGLATPFLRIVLYLARTKRASVVMPILGIVLVVTVAVLPYVQFEFDAVNYFEPSTPIARDFRTLDARLTGMLPFQVAVSGKHDPTSMLMHAPGMRKVIDISSIVRGDDRLYWCLADNDALAAIIEDEPRRNAWAAENSVTLSWLGVAAQLATGERLVRENAAAAIPTMGLLAGLAATVATKRLDSLWLGLVGALTPVAVLLLFVVALEIPLGLPSLVIGGIAVGLAIDDTLHLATTAQRRGSAARAVLECFRPCVGSSITAGACLMLFLMSPLAPIRQFGSLMASAALIGMLVNQFAIPQFIARQRRRG